MPIAAARPEAGTALRIDKRVKGTQASRLSHVDLRSRAKDAVANCDSMGNFVHIEFEASWGSDLGDGNHVELDICHACLKEALSPWLHVLPTAWAAGQASQDFMVGTEKPPIRERGDL